MALPIAAIAEAAAAAYEYYQNQRQEAANRAKREREIQRILSAIERARQDISNEMRKLELMNLEGHVLGSLDNYRDYFTESPPRSEIFLRNSVIAPLNVVRGRLVSIINNIGNDTDYAINAFPIYQNVVVLYLSSVAEWGVSYNENPESSILRVSLEACDKSEDIKRALKGKNDSRFGDPYFVSCIERCEFGEQKWNYWFDENGDGRRVFKPLFYIRGDDIFPHPNEIVDNLRRAAFVDYSFVPALLKFMNGLNCNKALLGHLESSDRKEFLSSLLGENFVESKTTLSTISSPNIMSNFQRDSSK